ncbi:PTS permease for mannose subunit III Man N terminal domain [Vibrio nigripulchritudo SFn27]|uniref:PTS permease for mannose subunit III Man N terminal domain n=1 Tax=Vibrio nigripulchritudo TaxID=28173 RepID=U4K719_9VIBR|nr:PTS galactosamine/N-acetylgalactosamine transporter subunit IIA [Vibrio nigripulchritudo]CCN84879.1 PTS permease for mannose subunit III Man N terminal domain [Vibrio nigripulchritudo BLFn1]CCN90091.1 PTS permease for mannose subunit III Man N terminal domain [Vibrio nigripulchritudo SFn27]CCN94296.1 PTS permease for mannose subunit III Man N terminal domain [Vibrio nigripulchritudo ENn2]CCO42650.1 PTS permease for mannose subunit III Man N terminal domain [Vibrio nigripulchritudo SFn135]CC
MIAVILVGHGCFGSGLGQAVKQIIGFQENFSFIDFVEGISVPELEVLMLKELDRLETNDGVVFLTDLLGGSPFRVASQIALERDNIEVISGTNLQLCVEMLLEREEMSLTEFAQTALTCGHNGLTRLADELEKQQQATDIDGGI